MKPAWTYFGAKTAAAETIWRFLGNPPLYVEPFCGTCSVLLGRPGWRPGLRRSEIVNDADGLLVNTLRAIRYRPSIVLRYAGTQTSEIDMHARQAKLAQVEQWCLAEAPADWRIVVCGYAGDHPALEQAGWAVHQGAAAGSGYSHTAARSRETLWASPACTNTAPTLC